MLLLYVLAGNRDEIYLADFNWSAFDFLGLRVLFFVDECCWFKQIVPLIVFIFFVSTLLLFEFSSILAYYSRDEKSVISDGFPLILLIHFLSCVISPHMFSNVRFPGSQISSSFITIILGGLVESVESTGFACGRSWVQTPVKSNPWLIKLILVAS